MAMVSRRILFTGAALLALAGGAAMATAQGRGGGTATYWMTAETSSGMAAMAGGSPASMIGTLMGRGASRPSFVHNLHLQLGAGPRPAGEPSAEHLPPPGLQAGASLPLVTPRGAAPAGPSGPWQGRMERPRGRMLIYWGCGEHARAGQPVVIDFAALTSGRVPAAFANATLRPMVPPSPATSPVYGEWPNQRSQAQVPAGGSLVGDHVVRGNYTPEIRFTLAPGQDFLAPVVLASNAASASGSVPLVWRPVPGARAWLATAMGAAANGDFVMWSSSETQLAAMGLDYLPEGELARLVQQRALLPAAADRCTVPMEVARAAPQSMLSLTAFGGEANFSHPVRPARAPASWHPDWTVKLRTKSTHMGLLGMSMEEMMGGAGGDEAERPREGKAKKLKRGLGKILGH
jgi:hypothetical protein